MGQSIRVIVVVLAVLSAVVYAANYGYGNLNCGAIRVDTTLDKMELAVQSGGGGCAGMGVLGWALTPSRDGTWYVTTTLKVEDNQVIFYGTLLSLQWKLRIIDGSTRQIITQVNGPSCNLDVTLEWWCYAPQDPVSPIYHGRSLKGFQYTMSTSYVGVKGRTYYAEVVMLVDGSLVRWPYVHLLIGYYLNHGYAGFPRAPEQ